MWFIDFIRSSIGKKWLMALTGCCLVLFLCSHAAGNATLFVGIPLFQAYADQLHSHPLIISILSKGLSTIFAVHIITGILLTLQNRNARDQKYKVQKRAKTRNNSQAAATMVYSGLFILLFLVLHTSVVSFGDHSIIGETIQNLFSSFFVSIFYIMAFIGLALHLSHGFWSMLQTFGLNHPRYERLINVSTYVLPVFFLLLFGSMPLLFLFGIQN